MFTIKVLVIESCKKWDTPDEKVELRLLIINITLLMVVVLIQPIRGQYCQVWPMGGGPVLLMVMWPILPGPSISLVTRQALAMAEADTCDEKLMISPGSCLCLQPPIVRGDTSPSPAGFAFVACLSSRPGCFLWSVRVCCLWCWRMFNSCLRWFLAVTGGKKGIECQIWVFSLICV